MVGPAANRPDSSSALFTCALAIGQLVLERPEPGVRPASGPIASGAVMSPGLRRMRRALEHARRATRSGPATRPIGRRDSDASPISRSNGCAASTPASRRIVVPELPQSIGARRRREPGEPAALHVDRPVRVVLDADAHRAKRARSRRCPRRKRSRAAASARAESAAKISARWPMLLSLGTGHAAGERLFRGANDESSHCGMKGLGVAAGTGVGAGWSGAWGIAATRSASLSSSWPIAWPSMPATN